MNFFSGIVSGSRVNSYNEDLRKYMLSVYNYMSVGLGITAFIAYFFYRSGIVYSLVKSPLFFIFAFAPLALVFYMGLKFTSMSFEKVRNMFLIYAALMGISLSTIFLSFAKQDIAKAFFAASATFAAMSIYGYTTKKDLSTMGSYLFMAVIGLIICSLINIFTKSGPFQFLISCAGVIIFSLLTAFDTQKIKNVYYQMNGMYSRSEMNKIAVFGAMSLYMDFINIFIYLLQIFASRRD